MEAVLAQVSSVREPDQVDQRVWTFIFRWGSRRIEADANESLAFQAVVRGRPSAANLLDAEAGSLFYSVTDKRQALASRAYGRLTKGRKQCRTSENRSS